MKKLPKDFFEKKRDFIDNEDSLKDVFPIDWKKVLKGRKNNRKQTIKIKKGLKFDN